MTGRVNSVALGATGYGVTVKVNVPSVGCTLYMRWGTTVTVTVLPVGKTVTVRGLTPQKYTLVLYPSP